MQLRAAEARRSELERAHADAVSALRGCGPDMLETKQSRVRELEKKVALETVRYVQNRRQLKYTHIFQTQKKKTLKTKVQDQILDAKNYSWSWRRRSETERKRVTRRWDNRGAPKARRLIGLWQR